MKTFKKRTFLILTLLFAMANINAYGKQPTKEVYGTWQWTNCNLGYPVYFEFRQDGTMNLNRMKSNGLDVDHYKFNREGSTIYYTRPSGGEPTVREMKILRLDDSTLILREEMPDGSTVDFWLERI